MFKFIRSLMPDRSIADDLNSLEPEASLPQVLDLANAKRVLVFAPHPDDECIGCAGTLALLSQNPGIEICVVLVTNGDGGQHSPDPQMSSVRIEEMRQALKVLGIHQLQTLGFSDGRFFSDEALSSAMDSVVQSFQPNWVFAPSPMDYHKDHVLVSHTVTQVCKSSGYVEQLIYLESWTPLPATHIVDITGVMDLKMKALKKHQTALKYGDYARAVEGLNAYRGLYLGFDRFAEAFVVQNFKRKDLPQLNLKRLYALGLDLKKVLGRHK